LYRLLEIRWRGTVPFPMSRSSIFVSGESLFYRLWVDVVRGRERERGVGKRRLVDDYDYDYDFDDEGLK
jgi:hypothetical protein